REGLSCWLVAAVLPGAGQAANEPKDLNPVTFKAKPVHPPVTLVEKGQPRATIAVLGPRSAVLNQALVDLQAFLQEATGAKLAIVGGKGTPPAIVVGNGDLTRQQGLDSRQMPLEGFAIKTAADLVFIAGRDETVIGTIRSEGTAWGIYEFLERFAGV